MESSLPAVSLSGLIPDPISDGVKSSYPSPPETTSIPDDPVGKCPLLVEAGDEVLTDGLPHPLP